MKLMLENGEIFHGKNFGAKIKEQTLLSELVFNTAMTGYQEVITDPSYCDQSIVMTYPMIGNYGISNDDYESLVPSCKAVVAKEFCETPSHWNSGSSIKDFFLSHNIPALMGVDTRKIVRVLREQGSMKAVFAEDNVSDTVLADALKEQLATNQIRRVSIKSPTHFPNRGAKRIVLLDFGYKKNILNLLIEKEMDVIVVPWNTTIEEINNYKPDGVVLSNGPGDPKDLHEVVPTVRQMQELYPMFSICMGHQVFALANSCDTHKLKFGHRGVNHPVKDLASGKVFITSQNHSYSVDPNSVEGTQLEISQVSLNDNTVEGLKHKQYPAFSVQYHPEASPGPSDTMFLFDNFIHTVKGA